jgi:CDP-6-deoxy-D-xylo-4-hexulose-3-dehydrase
MGEETIQFEEEWSDWLGCEYSVFVNSGSSANLLVMLSMLYSGRLRNKKVIVPAVGWATTAAPAIQLGFEPILCDADKDDLGLDLEDFENLCKIHRPSMVVLVHVLGHASKLNDLLKICEKYDVFLIEDTCEAYGSKFVNKKLGTFGTASTFSFFYGHQMSTIEGGMVSTDDRELYNIMLSVRSHGWLRDNEEYFREKHLKKYGVAEKFEYSYFFTYPGLNVRNTDLNAFIGRGQIKKIDSFIEKRNLNYYRFVENLKGKIWIQESNTSPVSALAFGVIDESRKRITDALIKENVECRPLICGSIQEHPFWFERYPKRDMPMALKVHKNGFYVPCHHKLTFDEIDFMCNIILENKKYRSF